MAFLCNSESSICISHINPQNPRKKKKKNKHHSYNPIKLRRFSYDELAASTNNFSPRNLLGKGSHGAVYYAALDGAAAVKVPMSSSTSSAENELEILSTIHSCRIVNLIGYAVDSHSGDKKLLLVVEYMPNGSLYELLHVDENSPVWSDRVRFALHVAKAVRTLHVADPPIIHRDIKSSNVLIDGKKRVRVSDFGLAVTGHVADIRAMSTPPAGTLGYLDPAYVTPENLSTKSDVFSFGILLLEIVSGRRAIDVDYSPSSIVDWALSLIQRGEFMAICDRRIRWPADLTVVREMVMLAARCVGSTAEKRPCMEEVVECLERVNKRARKVRIWNRIRRRVTRVENSWPLDDLDDGDHHDGEEEQVRICRRESSERVSDVTSLVRSFDWIDDEVPRGRHQIRRSKTIGSFREEKVGVGPLNGMVKISRGHVRVKVSTVRLCKSKSMIVLHGSKNAIQGCNNKMDTVVEDSIVGEF